MGFWGNLANFGLMAAPYVAAPFTGGLSIPLSMAIGAGTNAGRAALMGGDASDIAIAGGVGAIPSATSALGPATSTAIQAGASGGLSALQPGGLSTMRGTPFEVAPPPPAASAQPQQQPGFWSRIVDQAKEGMQQRDFWTTAAQQVAGGLEAARVNRMPMQNIRALEYIAGGGREGGQYGLTRPSSEREREEARKRLGGPGFWEQFLRYGAAPGLALYGSMLRPYDPKDGGQ